MSDTITAEEKSDILNRQARTEENVSQLTADVASLAESVKNIGEQQTREHEATRREISELARSIAQGRQGQWPIVLGIMSLVLVCMGGFATFVLLLVGPLREDQDRIEGRLHGRLSQLPHDYYDFGRNTKAIEILEVGVAELHSHYDETREELSYLTGRTQKIDQQLQAVDEGGSRIWNREIPRGAQ
jgi:DNA repair exonuclease SbcCD ATPase subunit